MKRAPRRVRKFAAPLLASLMIMLGHAGNGAAKADPAPVQAILSTFAAISQVPRCSKDEARISAWLVAWARERKLEVSTDAQANVLVRLAAAPGWEARPGVVLQAHMDMVCLRTEDSMHDFAKDPIEIMRDGGWLRAKDTTLGADNGIGVAIALTVAEHLPARHPRIEILFTTDEEKDMSGAAGLSPALLTGTRYINLDSENDSVVTLGAAGGVHIDVDMPLDMTPLPPDMKVFSLKVSGLLGGHSGVDIGKNRAGANLLLAELLAGSAPFRLLAIAGGSVDNAIATSAEALLAASPGDVAALQKRVSNFTAEARTRYPAETALEITLAAKENGSGPAASAENSARAVKLIAALPQGVTAWSEEFPNLPETSSNVGIVRSSGSAISVSAFPRSFHAENLEKMAAEIAAVAHGLGATSSQRGGFPAWPPRPGTGLYKAVLSSYERLFGSVMTTDVIHAGLECGYIADRYPAMEIVSIGPNLLDVHTVHERLEVVSLGKIWSLLQEVLQAE
ncbi:beta-Ala-His dipeptidase [Aestuariivirga sp.]|uniref:beta-Ala-His dipeptidase n=1 Tax=Aestuariivirga sp. TaxID=2650926 RepID=UPI003919DEA7